MPPEMRTRATLRSAEFGFLGVVVYTRVQTPRRCGAATFFLRPLPDFRPGVASFLVFGWRPLRTSWEVVGMRRARIAVALSTPGAPPGRAGPGHRAYAHHARAREEPARSTARCSSRRTPGRVLSVRRPAW